MKIQLAKILICLIVACICLSACMEIASPSPAKTLEPTNGIEIIVYTWDMTMPAGIPELHIWKNGSALWVTYGQDHLTHVYETYLSQGEMVEVQEILSNSEFWEKAQSKAIFTPSSAPCIWASYADQEGVIPPSAFSSKAVITSLEAILEASRNKQEYFPESGYLFISEKRRLYFDDDAYSWPDGKVQFGFDASTEGVHIDGEILSSIWDAVQQHHSMIASNENMYRYELKIPGVSCIISFEPYMCNIYSFSAELR